jgi:glucosamine--fructose-6-phosphate aminotransferase (isomerizing)
VARRCRACRAPSRWPSCSAAIEDLLIGARQGRAARRRLWRRARCIWAPTPGARAAHQKITYLEEGDWVVAHRGKARDLRPRNAPGRAAESQSPASAPDRQGQPPPLHGRRRSTSSRLCRPHAAHPISTAATPTVQVSLPDLPFDFGQGRSASPSSACGTGLSTPAGRQILVRAASRACRSRSTSPPSSATARRRCRPGGLALFVSQSGETADTLASLRYAKAQGQHHRCPSSTCRPRRSRARADVVLPTLAGPEIGVASTKAFTCQLAVLACARHRARAWRAADLGRRGGGALVATLIRGAAPDGRGAEHDEADREDRARDLARRATCSISAAAPAIRWRWKGR